MIRNGRPYTNENGLIDGALLTDREDDVITAVDGWIRKNIRAGKKILQGHTSYGMKHLLERDTGVYLTNNEFKDAMLLAGYRPVNPNDLNWKYRIELTREINDNPSPFFRWARNFEADATPCGDLSGICFTTSSSRSWQNMMLLHGTLAVSAPAAEQWKHSRCYGGNMREQQIEQNLAKAVKAAGGIAPKFTSPGFAGMPDRLVLMPGGHIGFVEVKAPGEKPRPLQLSRHRLLRRLGFRVYVLDDEKQIGGIIDEIQSS